MNTLAKNETQPAAPANGRNQYLVPLANILETKDGYVLEAEMPGVGKDGLDLTVSSGGLTILGRRTTTPPRGTNLYRESRDLDYRRVFELDPSIDGSKISAKMEQGLLRLHLPKSEAVKPRKIVVTD